MRWICNLRGASCLAVCLAVNLLCTAARAEDEPSAEFSQSSEINPLRLGNKPRAQAAGRWVEWRAGAKWEGAYEENKRHGIWEGTVPVTENSHFAESDYEGFESPFTIRVTLDRNVAHGEISGFDAQQQPIFAWHLDQGVLEGSATWWHPNGQTRRQVMYRAGLLDGPLTEWNADGKVILQETYREGRGSRAHIEWHQPGRKRSEGYSHLPGEVSRDAFDWQELRWSQNAVHEYFSEERCGRWTAWYENGQKRLQGNYQDGEAESRFTWWHPNGQKMAEGDYNSGKQHGTWRFWHSNGHKHLVGAYEYGQASGNWQAWSADGRPAAFDRAEALLALDWDAAPVKTQSIVKKSTPVARPTRTDAVASPKTEPQAAPAWAATTTAKPSPAKPTTRSASTQAAGAKSPRSQESNAGVFPGLLPGPAPKQSASKQAAPAPAYQSSDEVTLLGLLIPEPKKSKPKSTPTPARPAPPSTDDSSHEEVAARFAPERRSLLTDLLGVEPSPPPRTGPRRPVRR